MLSNDNIREINRAIESELREVTFIGTSDEEKDAALARIAKLKALLYPQPTREELLAELATALVEAQRNPPHTLADTLFENLAAVFRR